MPIKLNIITRIIFLVILFTSVVFADEALDKKLQGLSELKSAFVPQSETINTINNKGWSQSGLTLNVDSHWHLTISSKQTIIIKKISIEVEGVNVVNDVNLIVKFPFVSHYLFASDSFDRQIQLLTKGYKILGIVQQFSINDYLGYQDYFQKIIKITISWLENDNYNESSINFMMVYAK